MKTKLDDIFKASIMVPDIVYWKLFCFRYYTRWWDTERTGSSWHMIFKSISTLLMVLGPYSISDSDLHCLIASSQLFFNSCSSLTSAFMYMFWLLSTLFPTDEMMYSLIQKSTMAFFHASSFIQLPGLRWECCDEN